MSYKTVIFQFETTEAAKSFYERYDKSVEKEQQGATFMDEEKREVCNKKFLISYCKDISRNGINM
jgi:hypothetical protein